MVIEWRNVKTGKDKESKELEKRLIREREIRERFKVAGISLPIKCSMCDKPDLVFSTIVLSKGPWHSAYTTEKVDAKIVCDKCGYVMLFEFPELDDSQEKELKANLKKFE